MMGENTVTKGEGKKDKNTLCGKWPHLRGRGKEGTTYDFISLVIRKFI